MKDIDNTTLIAMNLLRNKDKNPEGEKLGFKPINRLKAYDIDSETPVANSILSYIISDKFEIEFTDNSKKALEDLNVFAYMGLREYWPTDKQIEKDASSLLIPLLYAYAYINQNNNSVWNVSKEKFENAVVEFSKTLKLTQSTIKALMGFTAKVTANFRK